VIITDEKAVLLVGGLGTRLRSLLPSLPKALAPIGEHPFLDLLIQQLCSQGIKKLIMSTGHLAEQIEKAFGDGERLGVEIEYSREPQPLGTGGAVKLAQKFLKNSADFLVMNGDSFLEINYRELIRFHRAHPAAATIACVCVEDASRYGTVRPDSSGRILEFCEKIGNTSAGLVNAGIYVFKSSVIEHIPDGQVSLEKDVFPKLMDLGVYASIQKGVFIDIGTPADYFQAQQILRLRPGKRVTPR
jgi:NDP-sugar pyrophosphorylase family protein